MRLTGQRVFLTGLGLSPAIAAVVLPASALALPVSLGVAGAGSVYAILSSLRAQTSAPQLGRSGTPLLAAAVLRDPSLDLPDLGTMRTHVAAILNHSTPDDRRPLSRAESVAVALRRVMTAWDCPSVEALNLDEVTELFLLDRLFHAPAGDAAAMAQMFHRPDLILGMRDEIDALDTRRRALDAQSALYRATDGLWHRRTRPQGGVAGLRKALEALPHTDIDLWHHVVLDHDPQDRAQRDAALWCLADRDCDQATLAAYLSLVAADGRLQAAARAGDTAYLDAVLALIEAWNKGQYRRQDLALDPVDCVAGDAPRFAAELDALAAATGAARWPEPRGLFAEYHGRAPRDRSFWCLSKGTLRARPRRAEFLPEDITPEAA